MARVPGSLAVATVITCAIFATATGIVGAVVTLMGLLAFPAMLKAGYNTKLAAGAITAGGCLGILIPPSVLLIVYGATAGVSVVKLYAGAFFPGIMLATLYVAYIIIIAKIKPQWAPRLSEEDSKITLPAHNEVVSKSFGTNVVRGLFTGLKGKDLPSAPKKALVKELLVALLPAIAFTVAMGLTYRAVTAPVAAVNTDIVQMGGGFTSEETKSDAGGLQEPPAEALGDAAKVAPAVEVKPVEDVKPATTSAKTADAVGERVPAPTSYWIVLGLGAAALAVFYAIFSFARLEIFKMLLGSFFPLAMLIIAVLGTIVFGLATPTEAAAMGSMGGLILAAAYRRLNIQVVRESVYLTAKTSAMVCWLFVGSSIFSAAFALLGGQDLINAWVLSMDLTPIQFMLLAQAIIFLLGWPLEWTEIIVIFMPIFIPLLPHFGIDPLFFGLLVALNLQTAFLSPPVAMAAFYLKGVSPPHVTLNQIFAGMLPFMAIQVFALFLLYMFPAIGMWLPGVLYK
jgi:TRAP-type mannitol/chloroaromatic compound transport system permease large subunit